MRARSAGVSVTSSAPSASLSWSRRRAPISGTTSGPRERVQAKASCAVEQFFARDFAERANQRHVARKVLGRKARHAGAYFAGRLRGLRAIADQAAREHAI